MLLTRVVVRTNGRSSLLKNDGGPVNSNSHSTRNVASAYNTSHTLDLMRHDDATRTYRCDWLHRLFALLTGELRGGGCVGVHFGFVANARRMSRLDSTHTIVER